MSPFGFKGKMVKAPSLHRVARLESEKGNRGTGLSNQSVLWSDANVFTNWGETAGNHIMYMMTDFALREARNLTFETPVDLLEQLLPITHEYGKQISCMPDLRMTF